MRRNLYANKASITVAAFVQMRTLRITYKDGTIKLRDIVMQRSLITNNRDR